MRRVSLEVVDIESPCELEWDDMTGDDRVRFCGTCRQSVFDLSAMSRDQAEALLTETQGNLCVRFIRRADGTVVTSDCTPTRVALARRMARRSLALAVAMAGAVAAALAGAGWLVGGEQQCATESARSGGVVDRLAAALEDKVTPPPVHHRYRMGRVMTRRPE